MTFKGDYPLIQLEIRQPFIIIDSETLLYTFDIIPHPIAQVKPSLPKEIMLKAAMSKLAAATGETPSTHLACKGRILGMLVDQ